MVFKNIIAVTSFLLILSSIQSANACLSKKQFRYVKNGFKKVLQCPVDIVENQIYYDGTFLSIMINSSINNANIFHMTKVEQELFKTTYLKSKECKENPLSLGKKSYEKECTDYSLVASINYLKSITDRDCGKINIGRIVF